ncbi:MAG: hypothetical protein LBJ47_04825, partial [Tannerella sp.]|nr:hypothetical protein [Tannerella sp.]
RIRAFQIGHTLTFDTDSYRFSYPEIDESARIIKHAAIRQVLEDGITKLKIYAAKDGKEKLTPDEFEAFKSYMTQSGAAGTHFDFVPPADVDILTLEYTVYRDPQVLDSEGNLLSGSGKPVEDAVRNYVDSIRYSGVFSRTKSIDAIQSAAGVMDAVLLSVRLNEVPVDSLSFKSESGFFSAKTVSVTYPPYHDN